MRAYVGLGSNLGDRAATIAAAVDRLRAHPAVEVVAVSALIETPAEPAGSGPDFLNGVAAVETVGGVGGVTPEVLLAVLLDIESSLGRRRSVPNAPRPIDLDLLTFGRQVRATPALTLPHPRMQGRDFVMRPLREVT